MSQNNTSPLDKINRAAWNLIVASKDTTVTTLITATQSGRLKLTPAQTAQLQELLQQSIEAGYHKAHACFTKEVKAALQLSEENATLAVPTKKTTKKN